MVLPGGVVGEAGATLDPGDEGDEPKEGEHDDGGKDIHGVASDGPMRNRIT